MLLGIQGLQGLFPNFDWLADLFQCDSPESQMIWIITLNALSFNELLQKYQNAIQSASNPSEVTQAQNDFQKELKSFADSIASDASGNNSLDFNITRPDVLPKAAKKSSSMPILFNLSYLLLFWL
eukprot:NODE_610_length_5431_cov_0.738560.p4 type:complete len:125 gc:universal NODE_610_length_5431_cov_0.738560:357-731(+)